MPRKPRFYLPNIPIHVVQRGNNRTAIFFEEADYTSYLKWVKDALIKYNCQLHAYVLMTNHVHLLVTPSEKESVSRLMQYIGRWYVPYINNKYNRSGTLWEGRYKSNMIQAEAYLFACMRYIELNPVRASMVKKPLEYKWSSYHHNALEKTDELITEHALYRELSTDVAARKQTYRSLFQAHIPDIETNEIRNSWQSGTPLVNDQFKEQIEKQLKTKIGYSRRGRPKKKV